MKCSIRHHLRIVFALVSVFISFNQLAKGSSVYIIIISSTMASNKMKEYVKFLEEKVSTVPSLLSGLVERLGSLKPNGLSHDSAVICHKGVTKAVKGQR